MRKILSLAVLFGMLLASGPVYCDMISPDNSFRIYADAIDTGGTISTGGVYSLQDSISEPIATSTTGGIYEVRGGYQAMTSSSISMSISSASLNLGDLSVNSVSSASTIVTITTDDESGYALSIASLSGTSLNAVAGDNVVTAGVEEYGVALSGADRIFTNDNAVVAGLGISSSSTPVNASATTLTFKASIGPATVAGNYSQTITLQASANLTL